MSINIDSLFQHLMKDPDIIPPEGEEKEDIAMAMARQRAKQSNNNTKALSMAGEDRSVSKLLSFLKAEDDEDDSPLTPAQMNAYAKHLDIINRLTAKLQSGGKLTANQQHDWDAAEKFSEDIAVPADLPGIHDVINKHEEAMVDVVGEGAGVQPGEEDDDTATPAETPAPKGRESFAAAQAGETPQEAEARAGMSREERMADARARAAALADMEEGESDSSEPHHSLTSAVDALSDATPDVELDNYGNDPDSPFHADRFGHTPAGARAFDNIHEKYRKEDLAQAYDQIESQGKQRAINFDGKDGGSLVESAIHRMMEQYYDSQGRQEAPSPLVPGQRPSEDEGVRTPAGTAQSLTPEEVEAARKERVKIEDTPASKWYEANIPDKGAAATAWDEYVTENFGDDFSKVLEMDIATRTIVPLDEHKINVHLYNFLKGTGKKNLTTPPKPTPTAKHVDPQVQKDIVDASKGTNPKQDIEATLSEHNRSVLDNANLTPDQQHIMIESAKALADIAAKKVSTPENKVSLELPTTLQTSEEILSQWADAHVEAEANGATDTKKTTAADNVHQATLMHEVAGGDAEEVLNNAGVEYKQLKNGQHYFQSSTAAKSRGDWGTIRQLAARDAGEQPSEGETTAPAVQYPQKVTQGESQAAFDFDAPAPSPVEQLADKVRERQEETPPETGTDDVTEKHMQAWLDNHVGQKEDPDYEPRRNQIEAGLRRQLEDEPGLLEEGKGWGEIRQRAEANNFMPELEEVTSTEETSEVTTPEPQPESTEGEAEQQVPPADEAGETDGESVDKPPPKGRTPTEGQQKLGLRRRRGEAAQPQPVRGAPTLGEAEDAGEEEEPDTTVPEGQLSFDDLKDEEEERKEEEQDEEETDDEEEEQSDDEEEEQDEGGDEEEKGGGEGDSDNVPLEEGQWDFLTSTAGVEQQMRLKQVHEDDAKEIQQKQMDAGFNHDEHGDLLSSHADYSKHTSSMSNAYMRMKSHLSTPTKNEDGTFTSGATSVPKDMWDKVFGEEGHFALDQDEDGNWSLGQHPRHAAASAKLHEDTDKVIKTGTINSKKQFLREQGHTDGYLNDLSDDDIEKEFKATHKKMSDKAAADKLKGIPDKEEVIQDMADAVDRGTDEEYKEKLRKDNKYTSVQDLIKQHKENQQRRADSAFEHASNDANSSALKMDVLPEEGTDKLHALDRARDIAKKMDTSNRAVKNGGKPLLDRNSMSHLKDLLDDAMDKGDLQQDEIDGIADEADRMGEDYLNDDHKASIDAANDKQRVHHEDFLAHAEGMSEEALQRKGHDLDHSKAHELHDYETNEDGTIGKRTGSSYHSRNEDGSVEHLDGSGRAESVDDAVEGMEAEHPPKLLGLSKQGQLEQGEHFDIMKRTVAAKIREGDFNRFKALEANNPDLADPKYKGQVLGAARHQLSAEDGAERMNAMGIDEKDHDEAAGSSCRPPPGAMPPGGDKGWNPDTHRWCDKEYLESIKGQLGPGEASYHPEGLHAGTDNAHLDQDADGNVQGVMVTPTGVHKVNPPTGGAKGMKSADGGAVNHADVLGHHLAGHAGGKVDKDTLHAMGMNHSEKHTGEGQTRKPWDPKILTDVKGTPGAKVLGKLGRMLQRNKQIEKGKPNATGQDRQRARRGTDGSPIKSVLSRIGDYTKEGLKDAAEELPAYAGGGKFRDTDRHRDKQTRKAVKKVREQESAAQKLTDSVNRVMEENG